MAAPFEDNFDRAPRPVTVDAWAPAAASAAPPIPQPAAADAAVAATDAGRASPARDAAASPGEGRDAGVASALDASAPAVSATPPAASSAPPVAVAVAPPDELGADWVQIPMPDGTRAWHIEDGWLCGKGAKNHGVWLNKTLPINARIEFSAKSDSEDGDLKAEVWGDGKSAAKGISYSDATSYLIIFGGWKNTKHMIARLNEHGNEFRDIKVDATSDDSRQHPVHAGQIYRFKVERTDGKTVRWFVDGIEYLAYPDEKPLLGDGHDHFAFNDWQAKVCFDNVKVTPL